MTNVIDFTEIYCYPTRHDDTVVEEDHEAPTHLSVYLRAPDGTASVLRDYAWHRGISTYTTVMQYMRKFASKHDLDVYSRTNEKVLIDGIAKDFAAGYLKFLAGLPVATPAEHLSVIPQPMLDDLEDFATYVVENLGKLFHLVKAPAITSLGGNPWQIYGYLFAAFVLKRSSGLTFKFTPQQEQGLIKTLQRVVYFGWIPLDLCLSFSMGKPPRLYRD